MQPQRVNISCLGSYGRFGNQLFQYAYARAYAEKCKAILHTPKWVGQEVFQNINDPEIDSVLPRTEEDVVPYPAVPQVDLVGYFQGSTHLDFLSINYIKSLFQINNNIINILDKKVPKRPYLACHLRRGDYATKYSHVFAVVSEDSYLRKVREIGWEEKDIVWISEEHSFRNDELPEHLQFLQDFYIMMKAEVLLRANSSFSWWAATLSENQVVYSPRIDGKTGWCDVPFLRGNYPAIIYQPPHHTDLHIRES